MSNWLSRLKCALEFHAYIEAAYDIHTGDRVIICVRCGRRVFARGEQGRGYER